MIPTTVFIFILLELLAVSYFDIKTKKISNKWSAINIVFYFLLLFVFPHLYFMNLKLLLFVSGILVGGIILFALNIMGAGDVKLLSTLYLIIPENQYEIFGVTLIYCTFYVALSVLLYNTFKMRKKILMTIRIDGIKAVLALYGSKFPFSPVFVMAWFLLGWEVYK